MSERHPDRAGQFTVSAAVLATGAALGIATWLLPEAPGYARVSARLFPALIATGLVILGVMLLAQAARRGFVNLPEEGRGRFNAPAFGWISAGLIAQMALIAGIGFILAATLLYTCAARGFGSARPIRDAAVGLVLGAVVFVVFTYGLTLTLPWGAWIPGAPK
jgi:putative tricarboxylic transport membrane protein